MLVMMKSGAPDGVFGKETDAVVRQFQGDNQLKPDGKVGRKTRELLDERGGGNGPCRAPGRRDRGRPRRTSAPTSPRRSQEVNDPDSTGPGKGVWYDYNYFARHKQGPPVLTPGTTTWRQGLWRARSTSTWIAPLDWRLKPGKSASVRRSRPGGSRA